MVTLFNLKYQILNCYSLCTYNKVTQGKNSRHISHINMVLIDSRMYMIWIKYIW